MIGARTSGATSEAKKLDRSLRYDEVDISDLIEAVSQHPQLVARLMRAANSAASASRMPVKTIKDAVVRLGNAAVLASVGEHIR